MVERIFPGTAARFRAGLVLFAGLAGCCTAGDALGQTLQDALVATYQTNPQLQADRARQRSFDEEVSRAWGGMRPTISFSGQKGRAQDKDRYPPNINNPLPSEIGVYRSPDSESVQLRQEIWDGNRTFSDVEHAKLQVANGLEVLRSTEQSVLATAMQAYYDLYRDQRILKIQNDFVASLEDERKATQARYRVKDVTQTDLAQSDARLARGIADAQQLTANVESSKSAFRAVTGIEPGDWLPDPKPMTDGLPQSLDEALTLTTGNPDLRQAILVEKAARADIDLAQSALLPDLSLQASSSRSNLSDYNLATYTNNTIVLALTVPLYDGGVASARTRGAKHVAGQRRLEIDATRDRLNDQIKRSWQGLIASRARIKSYEENVKANQIALTGVQQELRVGSRTVIDELNARQELLESQISLLQARHDAAIAAYSILGGLGRLTAEALVLPVERYDPTEHYESVRWLPWSPWIDTDYPERPEKDAGK